MAVQISSSVEFLPVNTSARAGTILLPSTNTFAGRIITIKDSQGTFGTNPLTISTIGGQIFEDGTTSKVLREPFGYLTLASDGANRWYLIDGTSLNSYTISNITNPLALNAQSVSTATTSISSFNLQDTRLGNVSTPVYARSTLLYLGSNIIGGTKAGPTQFLNPVFTFDPRQIQGLAIWLDANSVNGSALPNPISPSTVGTWCNLTGTGNFTQTTLSRQPLYLQNGLGLGRPSVYFSSFGAASGIQFLASPSNLQITRDASFFFVANYLSTSFMNQSATLIDDRKDPGGIALRTFRTNLQDIRDPVSSIAFAYFPNQANFPQVRSYRDTLNTSLTFLNGVPVTAITSNYNQQVADNFGILIGSHFNASIDDGLARSTFSVFHLSEFLVYNRCLTQSESWQVESYLGNKWDIQVTNTFNPSTINGLQLWLDASRLPVAVGGTLSQWNDLSPNQFTGTAVNSPTLALNTQNNLPGVSLNGINQYINFGNIINLGTSPIYVFTVLRINSGNYTGIVGKSASISGAGRWTFLRELGVRSFMIDTTGFFPDNRASFNDNSNTGTMVMTGFWDRSNIVASSNSVSRANTVLVNTTNYTTNNSLFVGAYQDNAGTGVNANYYMNGFIHEVLIYNSFLSIRQRQLIESYLGQKWNIPIEAPFTPLNVPGLSLWLDASQLVGLTNGAALSQWNDISPNLRTGTAINGPTYTTNSQNGLPGITFNGSSQYINFGNVMNMSTQPIYMFVVCKINSGTNCGIVGKSAAVAAYGRYTLLRDAGNMAFVMDFSGVGGDTRAQYADSSTATRILTAYYDRNTLFNLDNGYPTVFNSVANNTNMTNAYNFFVGAYQDGTGTGPLAGYFLNGVIYEVLVYQASMTYIQRQQIQNYLSAKWNVNLSNFAPNQITNMSLWLDAADTSSIVYSAAPNISRWNDKSGIIPANHANVVSGTATYSLNSVNLANSPMSTTTNVINSASYSMFFVGNTSVSGQLNVIAGSWKNQYGSFGIFQALAPTVRANINTTTGFGLNVTFNSNLNFPVGTDTLLALTIASGASSTGVASFNGIANPNTIASANTASQDQIFGIGCLYENGSPFYPIQNMSYREVLAYKIGLTTSQRQIIEGYLAWKWNIPLQSPFSPKDITGLQIWLDAADSSTVTGTTAVTTWADKSGNGRNLGSPVGGPIAYANYQGYQTIQSSNGALSVVSAVNLQSYTFFIVAVSPFVRSNQAVFSALPSGAQYTYASTDGFGFYIDSQVPRSRFYGGPIANVVNDDTTSSGGNAYPFRLTAYTCTSAGVLNSFINGNTGSTQNGAYSRTTTGQGFSTGEYQGTTSVVNSGNGSISYICEVLVYNSVLSDYNRQQAEGYLAWKWGLQTNLPATHPFRNNAPQHPFRNTPP